MQRLLIITLLFCLSACSKHKKAGEAQTGDGANTTDGTVLTNLPPNVPNTPTLHFPATSPNFERGPIFTVTGVKAGDTIGLFSDSACSIQVGAGTVGASETSIQIQPTNPLTVQPHTFYANASNAQHSSDCTGGVAYVVAACPDEVGDYIQVPENTNLNVPPFCVMKYEAKAQGMIAGVPDVVHATGEPPWPIYHPVTETTGHRPLSQADGTPWRSVQQTMARDACRNLGAGYDLISNPEWMTIAHNVEAQGANWSSTEVGVGCLFRGNNGLNDSCGYDGADPESGTGRDPKAKLVLSNNEEIWDFASNVAEWVDWTLGGGLTPPSPTSCASGWLPIPDVSCGELLAADYMPLNQAGVAAADYNSDFGLGDLHGGNGGAALRGGYWGNEASAGVFALYLNDSPLGAYQAVGFRCVYRP